MLSAARSPFDQFFSLKGDPLEAGKIYFGMPDQDPEQYPAQVFWDAEGTIPAVQPIRTISGYPARNGAPAQVYVDGLYSIRVRQSNNIQVFYVRSVFGGIIGGASGTQISFNQAGTSVVRTMQNKVREVVSATDFGAVGDGIVDDTGALQAFLNYISNRDGSGYVPVGNYLTTGLVVSGSDKHFKLFGEGSGGSIISNPSTPSPTLLLTHASGTVGPNQITIEGLTIAGNSSSRSAFFADDLIHSSFNDVYFLGSRIGFELNGAVDVVLNQCYIGDNSTGVKLWIDVTRPLPNDPCTMVTFRDTHIKDNSALGINIDGLNSTSQYSTNILFDGCNIEGNGQLNTPGNGAAYMSTFTRNVRFTNCWFEGNAGFISDFCQFSKYDNNYFVLNLGNATYGYNIFKSAGNYVVEDNWFVGFPASGINVAESQPDAAVLAGNWINNNKGSLGAPVFSVDPVKTKFNFDSYFIQTGTNASGTEVTITYQQPFKAAPIVVAQVISSDVGKINECEVYDVTSTNFKIRKKSFDGATIGLLNYTINWTALGQP